MMNKFGVDALVSSIATLAKVYVLVGLFAVLFFTVSTRSLQK